MDWPLAIERNRAALARIVAGLIAIVGTLTVEHLPRKVYRAVLIILRPAESAARRLIIIAAHGLEVKPSTPRPMPAGLKIVRKGARRAPRFQLFDSRKRFNFSGVRYCKPGTGPRITFFPVDDDPRVPLFRPPVPDAITFELCPARVLSETVSARSLCRRLAAINAALEDLPRQARRLARWRIRRARLPEAKFRDPLRPGPPPGHRKRPRGEIDEILRECHWLAWDRTAPNTS